MTCSRRVTQAIHGLSGCLGTVSPEEMFALHYVLLFRALLGHKETFFRRTVFFFNLSPKQHVVVVQYMKNILKTQNKILAPMILLPKENQWCIHMLLHFLLIIVYICMHT